MIDRKHDDFGNGTASLEEACGAGPLFLETRSARQMASNESCSFLVGARGTGKSLLLYKRKLEAKARGALVLPDATAAYEMRTLVHAGDKEMTVERWAALWEITLLRSIVVGWLGSSLEIGTQRDLDPSGDEALRRFVSENVDEFPPTAIFLDDEDDPGGAPRASTTSMMGCLLAVAELRRLTRGRIQFTMTVAPEIVWRLERHPTSAAWGEELVHLRWEDDELLDILRRRIARVDPAVLANPALREEDPIAALLGEIFGEPPEGWLLRSTLRRPRDLLLLGNAIVRAMQAPLAAGMDRARVIRSAIEAARDGIARAYLSEVAAWWPWEDRRDTSLRAFLRGLVPRNILAAVDVVRIEDAFARRLDYTPHESPFAILASLGLVGHVDEWREGAFQNFLRVGETTVRSLPRSRWYLIHPVLAGAEYGIPTERGITVGPDRPFDSSALRSELRSPKADSQTLPLLSLRRILGGDTLT